MPTTLPILILTAAGLLTAGTVSAEQRSAVGLTAGPDAIAANARPDKARIKLLVNARTIKIITRTGKTVTLRGPVADTELERIVKQAPGLTPGR